MSGSYPHVAIVADDLTGAMDAAAPFARRGLDVRVLTVPASLEKICENPPQILSINTGTRHVAEKTAAHIVGALVEELTLLKPAVLFKKIDSTLRGHVVAETIAAMDAAGAEKVVLCPAVPSQGRSLLGGEVYINGIVLHETAIGRDLRSPPPVSPLPELFRAALPGVSVILKSACKSQALHSSEKRVPRICIVDASSEEHLSSLAGLALENRNDTLFAGASGFTEALAERLFGPENQALLPTALPGKLLFVIGSQAPQSIAQMKTLVDAPSSAFVITPDLLPLTIEGWQNDIQEPKSSRLIIRAPSLSNNTQLDSNLIAKNLSEGAAGLLAQTQVGLLVATGGDTALALLDVLGVDCITLCGEIEPGVPHGLIETEWGPVRLVTKAGGFGDPELFCRIEDYFRAP